MTADAYVCPPAPVDPLVEITRQRDEAVKALRDLNAHVEKMQRTVTGYLSRAGSEHRSRQWLNGLIYHLDGPEQRDVQGAARAVLASAEARP